MLSTMQMRTLGSPSCTRDLGSTAALGDTRKKQALNPTGAASSWGLVRGGLRGASWYQPSESSGCSGLVTPGQKRGTEGQETEGTGSAQGVPYLPGRRGHSYRKRLLKESEEL